MPKLVYISNSKLPATSAHGFQLMQMCAAFSKNGYDVELVVPKRAGTSEDPFAYYDVKRNFKITKIPCIDFIFLSESKFVFLLQLFSFMIVCRVVLLFKKVDFLYSRELTAGFFFRDISLEVHSLPKKIGWRYLGILRRARALIVLTGFIKERLIKMGLNGNKILVSPDAVDLEKFNIGISKTDAREKLGLPPEDKLVGYVGMLRTLGMEKGIDVAVKALAELRDRGNVIFVFIGGYRHDIEIYEKLADKLGVRDKIIFTGMVKYGLVPLYLKALDILIAPFPETEHYKFFMSPLKIFEYMASGRPIISTTLPSLEEVLNSSNSVLVAPGSSLELASAVETVLDNGDLAKKVSSQALVDVHNYTWERRTKKILSFIYSENARSFSSELSVREYSKYYLRMGEEYAIKKYMPAGSLVLDVGCGAGRTTFFIAENGSNVIGIDIAMPLIEEARKKLPKIDFRVMDVRDLDFADGTFDTVFFSFNGLDNLIPLEERKRAINEIKRVLKPSGYLIYSSHNGLAIPRTMNSIRIVLNNLTRLRLGPHLRVEEYDFGRVTQYYNNVWDEISRLKSSGFREVELLGNGRRLLRAPKFALAFLDKFPIYVFQK